jgi:hypothetical protein
VIYPYQDQWYFIQQFILLPLAAIILAIFYFYFAYGYFSIVVLHRLTKASFKLDYISIIDLFMAYFFALIVFLVVYYHLQKSIFYVSMSSNAAILLGISIVYLGRLITKNLGVFYGKVHFSAIFLTGAVLILFRSIYGFETLNSINPLAFYNYSINGISYFAEYYSRQITTSAFAAIILSTFGELLLSMTPPKERKLVSVIEKFPSGFFTYTGLHERNFEDLFKEVKGKHHGLIDKLEQMLKPNNGDQIKTVKCAVKSSLWLIQQMDRILGSDDKIVDDNGKEIKRKNICILKRPDNLAILDHISSTFKRDPSPDIFFSGRENDIKNFIRKYIKRSKILKWYMTKEYDLGRMAFLAVEYTNDKKCMLLIVFDTGPRMNRVGLYTEEGYIVDSFTNLFDCAWSISTDYDPDKCQILGFSQ